jgi:hypothetical protein
VFVWRRRRREGFKGRESEGKREEEGREGG